MNRYVSFFILMISFGCQSSTVKQTEKKIACKLITSIESPDTASQAKIRCGDHIPFEAICDFTLDPILFGSGFAKPEEMEWHKHHGNEGVEFRSSVTAGFAVCKRI